MPKKGSNFIPLVLDTRLLVAVNGKASKKNQLNATYIMGVLVEHCKTELEPEAYEELKKRYSKTVYQQRKEKMAKAEAKLKREEEKLALKKRELAIKARTAKSFEKQTNYAVEGSIEENKQSYKLWKKEHERKPTKQTKRNMEAFKQNLEELGVDTDKI